MALHHREWGHIPLDPAHAAHHRQGADVHKLMDAQHATDHGTVADHHMAGHSHPIGDHDPVTQFTVVAEMAVGHQQIAAAQARLLMACGGAVDGDALTDGVVIAEHHLGWIAGVFQILGLQADAGARKDAIAAAHPHPTIQHHMGADAAIGAELNLRADHRIGPHTDPIGQLGPGINDGGGMDGRGHRSIHQ